MPKFLIGLGAYRYEQNNMRVEAETPEDACKIAFQDDDGEYEPGDLGDSFIARIEDEAGAELPIPAGEGDPLENTADLIKPAVVAVLRAAWNLSRKTASEVDVATAASVVPTASLPVFICHHEDKHRTYLSVHPDKASAEEQAIDYVIHEAEARGVDLGTIDQDADPIAAFQDVANGEGFLGIEETTLNLPPNYAAAPDMLATLREALDAYKGAFEDEGEVSGGDLVEWFSMWRETAKAAVAKAEGRSNG
jgi:hypothetical protein